MLRARETVPTARLEAHFRCEAGKTRLAHYFAAAPLKIAKTFAAEDGLEVCVMDCSPGLLAGDFYAFDWHLGENSRVFVTTQGFTRVHPSRQRPCLFQQKIRLESGATLEYFPEPLMLFRGAALQTESSIELEPGATLLFSEITCAGRIGRGEAFQFHSLQNRLVVRSRGQLIFFNQTSVRPELLSPLRLGSWNNFTHQGNFYVFSEAANDNLLQTLRALLDKHLKVWNGASFLEQNGLVVSLMGQRACDLQEAMQHLRETTRRILNEP